jgi:ubiquinone/menaquinone biosynthesis C-methylase UbiE
MSNKFVYKKKRIVEIYAKNAELEKPEEHILNILKPDLPEMKMLDIGVGGGRTTLYFAKLVKEYVGIDLSEEMIEACRLRFSDYPDHISFKVCDVRKMKVFNENSFDLILFSFNGIDYISHDERLKVFTEIRRILKPAGYFCFSSHNLQSIHKLFELKEQFFLEPDLPKKIIRWGLLRYIYNKDVDIEKMKANRFIVFNDGAERFGLQTYYIKPDEQIRQLEPHFEKILIYLLDSGEEIDESTDLTTVDDYWLYYLCS